MIIVDKALEERERSGNPIRVGLIGAGYMGRGITQQIIKHLPGMRISAIYNRTKSRISQAYNEAGVDLFHHANTLSDLENLIDEDRFADVSDPTLICQAEGIDAIIEATGEVDFGSQVALKAIENRKHVIIMGAEMDALVGPILKVYADQAGVVFSNTDGDQPGVVMNLLRFVRSIGYQPVLAGNIKGLQDHYRTPKTQKGFAQQHGLTPKMATSFADGTKISMEMAIVANATGFKIGRRGMYGPTCDHVREAVNLFPEDQLLEGGLVDYVLGAEPSPGVFVIGYNNSPSRMKYMQHFKMGDGPFYVFYTPYHFPHLEAPLTVARAVLFNDAAITPIGAPVAEVITMAKRDLKAGETLDGIGGFTCYGVLENYDLSSAENLLPMSQSEGCVLIRPIKKNEAITYNSVTLPSDRLCDYLRLKQKSFFSNIWPATIILPY